MIGDFLFSFVIGDFVWSWLRKKIGDFGFFIFYFYFFCCGLVVVMVVVVAMTDSRGDCGW